MFAEETEYPGFRLYSVRADSPAEVPAVSGEGVFRAEIPSAPENASEMFRKGYIFADRTLGVEVNLNQSRVDYAKLVRFEIRRTDTISEEIADIALSSFPSDRRFHVTAKPDMRIAAPIIRKWLDDLSEVYVCIHKEHTAGFLGLVPCGENACFVHLAAVGEKYRAAGAAVSLYAGAFTAAKERGFQRVCGRVSTSNTAVMNLYSRLGGVFMNPVDVFVRSEV